ncbi:MAG: hypothetical protein CVT80_04110 [Alphaproteobacteria bacterium HGW-Alphaproteobacteria-2]|nr:MAG: hypothetical protein CVT80_04110 [Alphaproteobacteria bacterium HGW-Alphaproteobacteria-2]
MGNDMRILPAEGTWVVRAGGAVIGESTAVLELIEGRLPPVIYFPRGDIGMAFLDTSATRTHCPWKGEASYYSIQTKSTLIRDAAWSYEDPVPAAEAIRGYLAFYPDKVTLEQL